MIQDPSTSSGNRLREEAVALFHEGIEAFDPEKAVTSALQSRSTELDLAKRVILISFGMEACSMARAALPFVVAKLCPSSEHLALMAAQSSGVSASFLG